MNVISLAMNLRGKLIFEPHLEKYSKKPAETQTVLLLKLVEENKDTEFGKDHNFESIKSVEDFRKNVPIAEYKDLFPYVERLINGETNILTHDEPVLFALTSGSTGVPKHIPITPTYVKDYSNVATLWFYNIIKDHPTAYDGKIFSPMPSPSDEKTKGGIPLGTISGHVQKNLPGFVLSHYVLKEDYLRGIEDYETIYYVWARFGIEADVSTSIMVNPATHILFAERGNDFREDIINDIETGKIKADLPIPEETRTLIESTLKPNPTRAAELRKIVAEKGELMPKDYWPNQVLVVCWKSSSMGTFIPHLKRYYGNVAVRDAGYSGTEGRYCTPLQDDGAHGVINGDIYFYEFIPEANMDDDNPPVLLAHEVELDRNYSLIITSANGLWRYNVNDVVRIVGYYNKTILIEFIHKGQGYSSLTGEKLSEWQVLKAVHDIADEMNLEVRMILVKGEKQELQHYNFYVGFTETPSPSEQTQFAHRVDVSMQDMNIEYKKRRDTDRLAPPQLIIIDGKKVHDAYYSLKKSHGLHDAQMKFPVLITDYNDKDFNELKKQGILD
ncbi:MAG: GH3 auxin-responsive promoter family protein [bacterium]|nr:GH3 auxin-responsive promoter family protein [bacterium]